MKRLLVVTVAALGFGLVACGGGGGDADVTSDVPGDVAGDVAGDTTGDTTGDTAGDAAADGDTGPEFPPLASAVDITPVIQDCGPPPAITPRNYDATIRWTSYGVPHIDADDLGSLGFGQGFAAARDHVCVIADQLLMANSERSRYFGEGTGGANLRSDLGWLALGASEKANCFMGAISAESREMVLGYVAGYNKWVTDNADALPAPCADAEWVRPITEHEYYKFLMTLVLRGSGLPLLPAIVTAEPPVATPPTAQVLDTRPEPWLPPPDAFKPEHLGSNGWGIGKDRTTTGRGMLIANPHFPWQGGLMWHEYQLNVPGELEIHGAALVGTPFVEIGFNEHLGWTHTVSNGQRFTLYGVTLHPEDPTVYLYGDELRRMSKRDVTVQVKQADGSLETVERTFYATHYGPVLNIAPLGWRDNIAATYRDANINNFTILDQFRRMGQASSLAEFKAAFEEEAGIPWVHTMYADAEGNAFYVDAAAMPHLSQSTTDWWLNAIETGNPGLPGFLAQFAYDSFGATVLDGSDPSHEWAVEEGAREPGLVPFRLAPQLERTDFVANANGTHWLTNPAVPLEGYSPLFGFEQQQLSPRTRMNLTMLVETGAEAASGADGKFDFEELKGIRENNRAMMGELLRDAVVARCTGAGEVDLEGAKVDVAGACQAIADWDLRLETTSVGAIVWRETLSGLIQQGLITDGLLWEEEFDVERPVATPSGLQAWAGDAQDPVLTALAMAVVNLSAANLAVTDPLSVAQYTLKAGERIPIPGGSGTEGAFNILVTSSDSTTLLPKIPVGPMINSRTDLTEDGYIITYGTSFVMALAYTDDGPQAEALITYSQSSHPDSPHYKDQTELFSQDTWRPVLFTEEALLADPGLTTMAISGSD